MAIHDLAEVMRLFFNFEIWKHCTTRDIALF